MNTCPKCSSDNWDHACVLADGVGDGVPHAILCIDCGTVYRVSMDRCTLSSDCWPFPCLEKPLTPLTNQQVKEYNQQSINSLGESPL